MKNDMVATLKTQIDRRPVTSYEMAGAVLVPVALMDSAGEPAGRLTVRLAVRSLSAETLAELTALVGKQLEADAGQISWAQASLRAVPAQQLPAAEPRSSP